MTDGPHRIGDTDVNLSQRGPSVSRRFGQAAAGYTVSPVGSAGVAE